MSAMARAATRRRGERGGTLIEFIITAAVLLMMLVGVVGAGHLFYTHNALVEATRRGARYALFQCGQWDGACLSRANLSRDELITRIRNVTLYNSTAPGASQISNLKPENVVVEHSTFNAATGQNNYGVGQGTVTARIMNYDYNFVIPGISAKIRMPEYRTALSGECAGYVPANR